MEEIWKGVVGYEGSYEVSSLGNVRSVKRIEANSLGRLRAVGGAIRKQGISRGYRTVMLWNHGRPKMCRVHSLVAAAFIGERPRGHHVNHIDFDRGNNSVGNLEYVTPKENLRHSLRAGRLRPPSGDMHWSRRRPEWCATGDRNGAKTMPDKILRGSERPNAALDEADIRTVRVLLRSGLSQRVVAGRFMVSQSTISKIALRKKWTHVP